MNLERIKSKLGAIYDAFVQHENFQKDRSEDIKNKAMFLGEADKLFDSNYSCNGLMGIYSYSCNNEKFIEFNLNEAPDFNDRSQTINWFAQHVAKARENLGK